MKRFLLLGGLLLSLLGCNQSSNKVVDNIKYESYKRYERVSYFFDNYARCHIEYVYSDEESDKVIEKNWIVYLNGYYLQDNWSTLLVCTTERGAEDYYLFAAR